MSSDEHTGRPVPERRSNGAEAEPPVVTSASDAAPHTDAAPPESTEGDAMASLRTQFQELREWLAYYAAARTDNITRAMQEGLCGIVAAALGFVAMAGLIVIASWFVLSGVAQGASALFGDRAWLGALLTGLLALAGIGLWAAGAAALRKRAARRRTVGKYETRHAKQRARFGRDVQGNGAAADVEHQ